MSKRPLTFQFPKLFKRIQSQQNNLAKHWIALREKKQYRNEHKAVLVQGFKTIKELRDQNIPLKSLILTAKLNPHDASEIKEPAASILRYPKIVPAAHYYLTDIDLTRRILGTASKPGNHDLFAEVPFPKLEAPTGDKYLVLDRINDPGNMGTLIRTARALGWNAGLITSTSCDVYNDKVIRASRALSLTWPHCNINSHELTSYLKENDIIPIVADMMPNDDKIKTFSMDDSSELRFWYANNNNNNSNFPSINKKKFALILSSEHGGVKETDNELRVSIPMNRQVESLNVAMAGAILMSEFNRLLKIKK